jgi:aspartyl-tRNA(Asn)/glutamyl-tRNA(Gln) amidotransferase subunit A
VIVGAGSSDHIAYSGVLDLARAFSAGELTSVEATRIALAQLGSVNPKINAFSQVNERRALSLAGASDERRRDGRSLGPLDGVPFSVKDTLVAEGFATRRGSKITSDKPATDSSPAVARVLEAGGVILGITTTPEFGGGPVTISPLTGITRNAWDVSKTAGGSSGGAATSIAAGIGAFALATDAGGSIRNPAALNGVVGYKATGGLVPTWPANVAGALSASGPIARSVADCAAVLAIIAQPDGRDPDALPPPPTDLSGDLHAPLPPLRIAVSDTLGYARHVDAAVLTAFRHACRQIAALGVTVDFVDPTIDDPLPIYKTLFAAGFGATLRKLSATDRGLIGAQLQALLEIGETVTLAQYFDAQQARRELAVQMHRFHETYDLLVTPMVAVTAFDAERTMPASFEQYGEPRAWVPFSYPFNLTQQPAISIPCGFTDEGLPVGLQVVGPRFADRRVLQFASALERQGISPVRHPNL